MGSIFFNRFSDLCKEKGTTPNSVAKTLGISSGSITAWKNGTEPRNATLSNIADYFGVTTDYLLGKEAEKAPTPKGERLGDRNVIRILGRDGSAVTKILTDEQLRAFLTMVDHLPEAEDL